MPPVTIIIPYVKISVYIRPQRNVFLDVELPIATGAIEETCRHLAKDRMDLTGTRWRLYRAEGC